ncbi:MAG TPA: hypothetical protein VI731_03215 [Bacteroidia bacterium]|nr:hypothetical protein [Bacteroidia bacterium]
MKHLPNHVAVWMDHHMAHLIYPKGKETYAVESTESPHDKHPRIEGKGNDDMSYRTTAGTYAANNEYKKHQIEQNELNEYYKTLRAVVANYDEILVFGPTTAGNELFNELLKDKALDGKRLWLEKTDKLTERQMIAYVRDYFAKEVVLK